MTTAAPPGTPGRDGPAGPAGGRLTLYHGTTEKAWEQIVRTGVFAPEDPYDLAGRIMERYGPSRCDVNDVYDRMDAWAHRRREENRFGPVYATPHRGVALGYAQAGGAPVYSALKAAYTLLHPDKVERSFFGDHVVGLDPWTAGELDDFVGRPVVITIEAAEDDVRRAEGIGPARGFTSFGSVVKWIAGSDEIVTNGLGLDPSCLPRDAVAAEAFDRPRTIMTLAANTTSAFGPLADADGTAVAYGP